MLCCEIDDIFDNQLCARALCRSGASVLLRASAWYFAYRVRLNGAAYCTACILIVNAAWANGITLPFDATSDQIPMLEVEYIRKLVKFRDEFHEIKSE